MGKWKVWLVVFIGFATALAVGVAVIAVHILSATGVGINWRKP